MKIALVTSWDEPCGIADYSHALAEALKPHVEIKIVGLKHGQTSREYFFKLGQACQGCDLAHVQHEYVFFHGRDPWNYCWPDFLRGLRIPYVVTSHTWLRPFGGGPYWKQGMRALRELAYRWLGWNAYLTAGHFRTAERVIVHSLAYARALTQNGLPEQKIIVLPQGVPPAGTQGNPARAKARWNLQGKVVVIFGFLIPSKGHLLAAQAWQKVAGQATLVVVGQPFSRQDLPYAKAVEQALASQAANTRLTGYLAGEELADILSAADLVLLPYTSATSSYSLSILLAQGKAVLASDLECFREIQAEQPCLELFKTNQADDLARRLNELLADETRLQQLRGLAKVWAVEHSWDRIASRLKQVYTECIKEK